MWSFFSSDLDTHQYHDEAWRRKSNDEKANIIKQQGRGVHIRVVFEYFKKIQEAIDQATEPQDHQIFVNYACQVFKDTDAGYNGGPIAQGQAFYSATKDKIEMDLNHLREYAEKMVIQTSVTPYWEEIILWLRTIYDIESNKVEDDIEDLALLAKIELKKLDIASYYLGVANILESKIKEHLRPNPIANLSSSSTVNPVKADRIKPPNRLQVPSQPRETLYEFLEKIKDMRPLVKYIMLDAIPQSIEFNQTQKNVFLNQYRPSICMKLEAYLNKNWFFRSYHAVLVQEAKEKIFKETDLRKVIDILYKLHQSLVKENSLNALPIVEELLNGIYDLLWVNATKPASNIRLVS